MAVIEISTVICYNNDIFLLWSDHMNFAQTIKQIRCRRLLSQEDFAKELGVSFTTVNRWETGKSKPSFKALRNIDDYCKKENIEFNTDDFSER